MRKEKNLTLRELSDKSGIELTYLSKIENSKTGGKSAEEETIKKLAEALNVDNDTREELFRLGKQFPLDLKNKITESKLMYEICRSVKDLDEQDLQKIVDDLKNKKSQKK